VRSKADFKSWLSLTRRSNKSSCWHMRSQGMQGGCAGAPGAVNPQSCNTRQICSVWLFYIIC